VPTAWGRSCGGIVVFGFSCFLSCAVVSLLVTEVGWDRVGGGLGGVG